MADKNEGGFIAGGGYPEGDPPGFWRGLFYILVSPFRGWFSGDDKTSKDDLRKLWWKRD